MWENAGNGNQEKEGSGGNGLAGKKEQEISQEEPDGKKRPLQVPGAPKGGSQPSPFLGGLEKAKSLPVEAWDEKGVNRRLEKYETARRNIVMHEGKGKPGKERLYIRVKKLRRSTRTGGGGRKKNRIEAGSLCWRGRGGRCCEK